VTTSPAYFELNFRPNVILVSVVRRFVTEFYRRFFDPDSTSRVALATHELLENAVKYAKDGETTIRIQVGTSTPTTVEIVLRNRARDENIAQIRELLAGLARAATPHDFYQALLVEKAKVKDGSGLGIARVVAEGEMAVRYEVVDGDIVVISATTTVGPQGR